MVRGTRYQEGAHVHQVKSHLYRRKEREVSLEVLVSHNNSISLCRCPLKKNTHHQTKDQSGRSVWCKHNRLFVPAIPWIKLSHFHRFSMLTYMRLCELTICQKNILINRSSAWHLEAHVLSTRVLDPDSNRSGASYHDDAERQDGGDHEHYERDPP